MLAAHRRLISTTSGQLQKMHHLSLPTYLYCKTNRLHIAWSGVIDAILTSASWSGVRGVSAPAPGGVRGICAHM